MSCGFGLAQSLKSFDRYEGKSRFDVANDIPFQEVPRSGRSDLPVS